jgi:3-carboxy-cis,cis-muconate cycloisomerase
MTLLSALTGDTEIEALLSDAAQLTAMLAVERGLAIACAEVGWISAADETAVLAGIENFVPDWDGLRDGLAQDGVVVPALVKQLRGQIAPEHRAALHKGATSQDIIDTGLMVQLMPIISIYENRISGLLGQLETLNQDWGGRALMAHTRMQVALPTNWTAKLSSWSEALARHLRALTQMRRSLLVVQLGGPVGDQESFEGHGQTIAEKLAREIDLGYASPWQTSRDPIVGFGNLLALITGTLGKIGADIALLAQNEVAILKLEGGGASSAMAHKANPVNAEVLVSLARANAGLAGTLQQAMVHEYERSGAAWTLEWLTLPHMLINTGASLRLGQKLIGQIRLSAD